MKDLIDRQEAINVVAQYFKAIKLNGDICIDGLKMLPFAQPTVEAIPIDWIDGYIKRKIKVGGMYAEMLYIYDMLNDWEKENG